MSDILLEATRGQLVENIHRGDIAIVGRDGKLQYYKGDPFKVAYIRSALKPIQALNVFLSGADQKYHFDDEEISLICASHYGQDIHRKVMDRILKKIGLKIENLLCGATYSLKQEYKIEQIAEHVELTQANTDCSGKHAGMLAACLLEGYSIENYNLQDHPIQKDIKNIVSNFCEIEEEKIAIGIDGCGVPVHGMPLYNAALGFAKLACPDGMKPELMDSCERIFVAMNNAPEMVAGTGGFCTELIKNTNGKLIGKLGADGVYCLAVKGMDIGIAVKIEDGNSRAIPPVVIRCLEDLGVLSLTEIETLESFRRENLMNNLNSLVGEVDAVFHLDKAVC